MKSSKELEKCVSKTSSTELGKKYARNVVRTRMEYMKIKERGTRQESMKE